MRAIALKYVFIYIAIVLLPLGLLLAYATQFLSASDQVHDTETSMRLLSAFHAAANRTLNDVGRDAADLRAALVTPPGEAFLARAFTGDATDLEWARWANGPSRERTGAHVVFVDPTAGVEAVSADSVRILTPAEQRAWTVRLARGRWREHDAGILTVGRTLPGGKTGGDRALEVLVSADSLAARAAASLGDQADVTLFVMDPTRDVFVFHSTPSLVGTRAVPGPDVPTRPLLDGALVVGARSRMDTRASDRFRGTLFLVAALAALGSALVLAVHVRTLARDLDGLSDSARRYGEGQLDHRIVSWRNDEVGRVARSMNAMAEKWDRDLRQRDVEARFDVLKRLRQRVSADIGNVREGLLALSRSVQDPTTPRIVLRGASAVLTRLAERLTHTEIATLHGRTYIVEPDRNGRPVELRPLIESCTSRVADASEGRIRVQLDVPAVSPDTTIGEETLRGVFMSVVDNAARAMPEGGTLKVEVIPEETRLTVHVIDSGHGIPSPFLRRRLFQPFASAWRDEESFGLALHRARDVLRQLGGDIDVSSREEVGTRVSLRLPIA